MMKYERFTQWTESGASLILDNPQNAEEARNQLMEKFKLACNKLAELEDKIEQGLMKEEKTCVFEEWQDVMGDSVWQCSNCKEDFCFIEGNPKENMYGYCPNCGARLTGLKELQE